MKGEKRQCKAEEEEKERKEEKSRRGGKRQKRYGKEEEEGKGRRRRKKQEMNEKGKEETISSISWSQKPIQEGLCVFFLLRKSPT